MPLNAPSCPSRHVTKERLYRQVILNQSLWTLGVCKISPWNVRRKYKRRFQKSFNLKDFIISQESSTKESELKIEIVKES